MPKSLHPYPLICFLLLSLHHRSATFIPCHLHLNMGKWERGKVLKLPNFQSVSKRKKIMSFFYIIFSILNCEDKIRLLGFRLGCKLPEENMMNTRWVLQQNFRNGESEPWRQFVHPQPEQAQSSDTIAPLKMRQGSFKRETGSCN